MRAVLKGDRQVRRTPGEVTGRFYVQGKGSRLRPEGAQTIEAAVVAVVPMILAPSAWVLVTENGLSRPNVLGRHLLLARSALDHNGAAYIHFGEMRSSMGYYDNNGNHTAWGAPYTVVGGRPQYCESCFGIYTAAMGSPPAQPIQDKWVNDPWFLLRSKSTLQIGVHLQVPGPGIGQIPGHTLASDCNELINDVYPDVPGNNDKYFINAFGYDPTVTFGGGFRGYTYWKEKVQQLSREQEGFYYLIPDPGDSSLFYPPGRPDLAANFEAWTSGETGYFFFDTTDGQPPRPDNMTAAVSVNTGWWSRGLVYLNTVDFGFNGNSTHHERIFAPHEPLWEPTAAFRNDHMDKLTPDFANGIYPEGYLNLLFPNEVPDQNDMLGEFLIDNTAAGQPTCQAQDMSSVTTVEWDRYGMVWDDTGNDTKGVIHNGIIFIAGGACLAGGPKIFGTIITGGDACAHGNPDIYYKDSFTYTKMFYPCEDAFQNANNPTGAHVDQMFFDY